MLKLIIKNIFVVDGGQVIQHSGTNCAPLLAGLFLYSYTVEFNSNASTQKNKYCSLYIYIPIYIHDGLGFFLLTLMNFIHLSSWCISQWARKRISQNVQYLLRIQTCYWLDGKLTIQLYDNGVLLISLLWSFLTCMFVAIFQYHLHMAAD
jgi:hypothetical protein